MVRTIEKNGSGYHLSLSKENPDPPALLKQERAWDAVSLRAALLAFFSSLHAFNSPLFQDIREFAKFRQACVL